VRSESALIDAIYEAAVVPGQWPGLLDTLAVSLGGTGGVMMESGARGVQWVASPVAELVYGRLLAQGWGECDDRIPRLLAAPPAGFVTDADVIGADQTRSRPLYAELLKPAGFHAAAASVIRLAESELVLTVEGFASQTEAHDALPALNRLRPHLARAGMLSARLGLESARAAVAALEQVGAPAAMLGHGRRVLAANALFTAHLDAHWHDTPGGMRLADATTDTKFGAVLDALRTGKGSGASLPMRHAAGGGRAVLHVLPMRGEGRELFFNAAAMAVIAVPGARAAPSVELIQGLLDLTPAEALLARAIAGGRTLAEAATDAGICPATARTHLKRIFAKTGMSRQAELVAILGSVAAPGPASGAGE
jgi:DNA-binding CsgD family transcriptional regulator